jgi:pyruvate,water dikinase
MKTMKTGYVLSLSDSQASLETVGGKGVSLARLVNAGLPVPGGFHITTAAYQEFVAVNRLQTFILETVENLDASQPAALEAASRLIQDRFALGQIPEEIAQAIARAYQELPGDHPVVAVRSSATAEDLPGLSFAGQQETYLNIHGLLAVQAAVRRCWASLWTARAIGYRLQHGIDQRKVSLAVVVQVLVPAEAAGILFTANPVTGQRQQALISSAWGLGEAIVGGLVTPDTFTIDKASGQVLNRQLTDKQVMTVLLESSTAEKAVPKAMRRRPSLSDAQIGELVRLGGEIEQLYGTPMDIEWAVAGGQIAILQARPITALPEAATEPPLEWTLPDPKGKYMRASICELMSDPLSPLFASLGLSAIENGINLMAKDMFNLPTETLSGFMLAIDGYAYQRVNFSGRQWFQLLATMGPRIPRMMREGVSYWQNVAHPRYARAVSGWKNQPVPDLSPGELWSGVQEIMDAYAQHIGSLMASTMGPSAGSEGLFTQVYEKMVMRPGDPPAPAFLMGYDSLPIKGEKALYDLAMWCRERPILCAYLADSEAGQVAMQLTEVLPPGEVPGEVWEAFRDRFQGYLDGYGYSIYDMDFAKPLPIDDPEPILENLKLFITGQARDPYQRQQAYAERRQQAVEMVRPRLKGFKRWAFEKTLRWAQSQAPLREDGIVEIGLGYPVLRCMLLELGERFSDAGAILGAADIFWLEQAEVEAAVTALEGGENLSDYTTAVQERQALWQRRKRLTPPAQLPPKMKMLGMNLQGMLAVGDINQVGDTIKGVAASPGQVKGCARVLHGPADFDQMQPGDILVAPLTTPAWTPLFAIASAVVTDIGGPLSHGSIVAREYGIPAVLGTGIATRRIASGQTITVDGSAGLVVIGNGRG